MLEIWDFKNSVNGYLFFWDLLHPPCPETVTGSGGATHLAQFICDNVSNDIKGGYA